ncbi:Transcription factor bHLH25 [Bienertia sinuspersici]
MMMSSMVEDVDYNDIFQPSDIVFASNKSSMIKTEDDFDSTYCDPKVEASGNHNKTWSTSGKLISFGSSNFGSDNSRAKPKKEVNNWSKNVGSTSSNEHVVAERLRREKMTQGFVALSALIPGLKKVCFVLASFLTFLFSK